MKFILLFIGLSLWVLNAAQAAKYSCYLPHTSVSAGHVIGLKGLDVKRACQEQYPTSCSQTNSCTPKPQGSHKKSSSFF